MTTSNAKDNAATLAVLEALVAEAAAAVADLEVRTEEGRVTKGATKKAASTTKKANAALVEADIDPNGEDADTEMWAATLADVQEALKEAKENEAPRGMSNTLNRYKPGYVQCVAYSGAVSQNNGDVLAQALEGKSPAETAAFAERVLGLAIGTLSEKYANLNPGQVRMNSGNRIRNAIKRGDVDEAVLADLA